MADIPADVPIPVWGLVKSYCDTYHWYADCPMIDRSSESDVVAVIKYPNSTSARHTMMHIRPCPLCEKMREYRYGMGKRALLSFSDVDILRATRDLGGGYGHPVKMRFVFELVGHTPSVKFSLAELEQRGLIQMHLKSRRYMMNLTEDGEILAGILDTGPIVPYRDSRNGIDTRESKQFTYKFLLDQKRVYRTVGRPRS